MCTANSSVLTTAKNKEAETANTQAFEPRE